MHWVSWGEVGYIAVVVLETPFSLHTEQQVPGIKRRSEEKGGKTIRRVKELLRKKQTTKERGHTVFFFPFCGNGMGSRALHGLAPAVLLSYTLRPIFQL